MTTDTTAGPATATPDTQDHAVVQETLLHHDISTCTISDVLDGLAVPGRVLDPALRRVSGGSGIFCGVALPVSWVPVRKGAQITASSPSTWSQVRDFIVPQVASGRGRVYVAGSGPLVTNAALAGGLSVTYLLEQVGFEGVVLGGAVRDYSVVTQCRGPVIATNFVPTDTQGAYRVDSVDEVCTINNVTVRSGDWILSDCNGTVVVPAHLLADVLAAAVATEETERSIMSRVHAGERLPQVIDAVGRI